MTNQPTILQTIREARGLTRRECAEAAGVTFQTWKRWELGLRQPTARGLLDAAAFLRVPAEDLRPLVAA